MPSVIPQSHVQVYSGHFQPETDYKKYDIVSVSNAPGVFYYAKEDIVLGGGAEVNGSNKFIIRNGDVAGPDHNTIIDTVGEGEFRTKNFKAGQLVRVSNASTSQNNNKFIIESVTNNSLKFKKSPLLSPLADETNFNAGPAGPWEGEPIASNNISIQALDETPGKSSNQLWSHNDFFFDPDYGSTANFTTEIQQTAYGDGYYSVTPKSINCVLAKFNLTFDNRTTREASCIMHFLENKLGQHEVDAPVDYLPYKQGISGFYWGGDSMFSPYNSTENLTKTFICKDFSHSLTSENSNKVTCVLENFDTSILRKSEQIWTERVKSWDKESFYNKDDIVYVSGNHQFYYHSGDAETSQGTGYHPTGWGIANVEHTADEPSPWTREFYWKPSLGLAVKEKPRLKEATLGQSNYTQIYSDGINESLIHFPISFKNRSDKESKAILHFLETHYGAKSFSFTLPAPYNQKRRFLAPQWDHSYVFKNTHDIKTTFVEFPFNFTDEEFDNIVTDTPLRGGDLHVPRIVTLGLIGDGEKRRCRITVKNLGDLDLTDLSVSDAQSYNREKDLYNIQVPEGETGGAYDLDDEKWTVTKLTDKDRAVVTIEAETDVWPAGLEFGQTRIAPNISNGPEGGLYFHQIEGGQIIKSFFQNNQGNVQVIDGSALPNGVTAGERINDYLTKPIGYVNWRVINSNAKEVLQPGESCYFELEFDSSKGDAFEEDKVYVAQFTISAKGELVQRDEATVLVLAFAGSKWRAHQLNQHSSVNYGDGTIYASKIRGTSETKNTNPYIYYDGNFDGTLSLVIEKASLRVLGSHPTDPLKKADGSNWEAGSESVVQWAVSINGGRSWRMKSQVVTYTNGGNWTYEDQSQFKESWSGLEASDVSVALADLVSEDMISYQANVPFSSSGPTAFTAGTSTGRRSKIYEGT